MEQFTFFYKGVFSQWHPSVFTADSFVEPGTIEKYTHAEQYMMAEKARLFGDKSTLQKIMKAKSPWDQKALGKEVSGFDKGVWNKLARTIVYKGNYAKFTQNPAFRTALIATAGTTLVEASPTDEVWGIGLSASSAKAKKRETWQGTNWLGEVLTKLRDDLIKEESGTSGTDKAQAE